MSSKLKIKNQIEDILKELNEIESDLTSAKRWGIFDLLGGKGISSFIKHTHINSSEAGFREVLSKLKVLELELSNTDINLDETIYTSGINEFLDIFLDNIFSDLFTQSKISENLDKVKNLKYSLEKLYSSL